MVEELKLCVDVDEYALEFGVDAKKVTDIMPRALLRNLGIETLL